MSITSLSSRAWISVLGSDLFYSSDQPYAPLENIGSPLEKLPPILSSTEAFDSAMENPSNISPLAPYIKPIKISFLHQAGKPIQCVARVIALLAITTIVAPLGVIYYGALSLRDLVHYAQTSNNESWEKVKAHSSACFRDLAFFGGIIAIPYTLRYKFLPLCYYLGTMHASNSNIFKKMMLDAAPRLTGIAASIAAVLSLQIYGFMLLTAYDPTDTRPLPCFQTPDIYAGLIIKKIMGLTANSTWPLYHPSIQGANTEEQTTLVECAKRLHLLHIKEAGHIANQIILELKKQKAWALLEDCLEKTCAGELPTSAAFSKYLKKHAASYKQLQPFIDQLDNSIAKEQACAFLNSDKDFQNKCRFTFISLIFNAFVSCWPARFEWSGTIDQKKKAFEKNNSYQDNSPNVTYATLKKRIKNMLTVCDMYRVLGIDNVEKDTLTLEILNNKCLHLFSSIDRENPSLEECKEMGLLSDIVEFSRWQIGLEKGWYSEHYIEWRNTFINKKAHFLTENQFTDASTDNDLYSHFNQLVKNARPPLMYELLNISAQEYSKLSSQELKGKYHACLLVLHPDKQSAKCKEEASFFLGLLTLTRNSIELEKGWSSEKTRPNVPVYLTGS